MRQELLTTTRAVRRRLDFSRPVPRELLRDCVALAAPGSVGVEPLDRPVRDRHRGGAPPGAWRGLSAGYAAYQESRGYIGKVDKGDSGLNAQQQRTAALGRPPRRATSTGRRRSSSPAAAAGPTAGPRTDAINLAASVHPAMWSFMLRRPHARARERAGPGSPADDEKRAAGLVGIPDDKVTICADVAGRIHASAPTSGPPCGRSPTRSSIGRSGDVEQSRRTGERSSRPARARDRRRRHDDRHVHRRPTPGEFVVGKAQTTPEDESVGLHGLDPRRARATGTSRPRRRCR